MTTFLVLTVVGAVAGAVAITHRLVRSLAELLEE